MQIELLIGKLHQATVTQSDLNYQGSITIDEDLIDAVGFVANQKVDIYNINTGGRFATYVIRGTRGRREICLNGAAARLVQVGDRVIIAAFGLFDAREAAKHEPQVILLNANNEIIGRGH
jgi:aspartate 1-decarboxylase